MVLVCEVGYFSDYNFLFCLIKKKKQKKISLHILVGQNLFSVLKENELVLRPQTAFFCILNENSF
jgi:hypothetical protein